MVSLLPYLPPSSFCKHSEYLLYHKLRQAWGQRDKASSVPTPRASRGMTEVPRQQLQDHKVSLMDTSPLVRPRTSKPPGCPCLGPYFPHPALQP